MHITLQKKCLLGCVVLGLSLLYATGRQMCANEQQSCNTLEKRKLIEKMGNLLTLFEVKIGGRADGEELSEIVKQTQEEWVKKIRPGTTERWEIGQSVEAFFEMKRDAALPLFQLFGLKDACEPFALHYQYVCMLGSLLRSFVMRFRYLLYLYERKKIGFESIVILVSDRPLNQHDESKADFDACMRDFGKADEIDAYTVPNTESEMACFVLKYIDMPVELRSIPVTIISSPMKIGAQGQQVRPTTADTVVAWLNTCPNPGTVLAISNQPYCLYQDSILKTLLPHDFVVETVGDEASPEKSVALYLDSLARYLYQEKIRLS